MARRPGCSELDELGHGRVGLEVVRGQRSALDDGAANDLPTSSSGC